MLEALPTADHEGVQAFRFDLRRQFTVAIRWQAAPVQFQILDTSTLLAQALCQQTPATLTTHDQNLGTSPGESLTQRREFKQGFAVVAIVWIKHREARIGQDLPGGRPHAEPGLLRRLGPMFAQLLQAQPGGRLTDDDHGAVLVEPLKHRPAGIGQGNRFNIQQRQATAEYAGLGQGSRQGRRLVLRSGQQQPPAHHAWPASP